MPSLPPPTKALLAAHDNLSLQIKACLQPIGGHRAAFASAISLPAYPLVAQVGMTNDPGRAFAQLAPWKGGGPDHATARKWAEGDALRLHRGVEHWYIRECADRLLLLRPH